MNFKVGTNQYKILCMLQMIYYFHISSMEASPISISKSNQGQNYTSGELMFSDEFDTLDLETWTHEKTLGSRGWEFQAYLNTRNNSFARNGNLFIKPTLTTDLFDYGYIKYGTWSIEGPYPEEMCTDQSKFGCVRSGEYPDRILNPVLSAKLKTVDSFYFTYGRVEIRAKLPSGDWMWPALALKPRFNNFGSWPLSGEISLMESRGNQQLFDEKTGENVGTEKFTCGTHFGPVWYLNRFDWASGFRKSSAGVGFDQDFHIYELIWTDRFLEFRFDRDLVRNVWAPDGGFWEFGQFKKEWNKNPWETSENPIVAPFDQKFYLQMNVAVGGGFYFSDSAINKKGKKPWKNDSPRAFIEFFENLETWYPTWKGDNAAFQIDYVRIYAL